MTHRAGNEESEPAPGDGGTLTIVYRFEFDDEPPTEFRIDLDAKTLELVPAPRTSELPDWTRLDNAQCPNCPLDPSETPRCPIAVSLIDIVEFFASHRGHDEALVSVHTASRTVTKRCSLQVGISSLMGLVFPASGCPIVAPLRPLLRSHLPFATSHETIPRVAGWYLLQQFHNNHAGLPADWDLSGLQTLYADIEVMNANLPKRLDERKVADASRNAVIHLRTFAELFAVSVSQESMRDVIESLRDPEFGSTD